jgi:carbon storage regulator
LSRKQGQEFVIPAGHPAQEITVTVVRIRGDKVRLGVRADPGVPVHRREVFEQIEVSQSKRRDKSSELPPQSGLIRHAKPDSNATTSGHKEI